MEIEPGISIVGSCLAIGRTLILGDLHIGAEEALNKQGFMIPRFQFLNIRDEILEVVGNDDYDTIIINGDLKHEFGTISQTEWSNTMKLLEMLLKHSQETVL